MNVAFPATKLFYETYMNQRSPSASLMELIPEIITSRDALAGSEVIELTQGSADVSAPVDLQLVLAQVQTHHGAVLLHTANKPSEGGQ